ncbi:hypothetical protein F5B22DRAFT_603476 [Xylaria bambusicola]|uniref:uncharacterized protein n=1 Tax=Xylaria bambusicola TaxID=326684 RepID=UPI002007A628|nr:uncharacterized protein F5B22DRAFT_603476 [Xylaria bambusicola]KAI0517590.1 hypothetical protein F5B22DRAFT_603476 [Xylaria bambusicola]
MEKYSQFRDRGSGISPFLPIATPTSVFRNIGGAWLFLFRLPVFVLCCASFFLVLDHIALLPVGRKILLWLILATSGVWWIDLQLDGVKRGSLSQQDASRFPAERAIIAAQFTSPIDALYLASVFDPIFVVSYPGTRKVKRVSLFRAATLALSSPNINAPEKGLTDLRTLIKDNPHRVIAVFPEMTTTNGKGILPLSTSLLTTPPNVKIFPVSLRYTAPDITTPVPGAWSSFLWNLLSRPKHYIRVRIAEGVTITYPMNGHGESGNENGNGESAALALVSTAANSEEQKLLDHIGESLARLARNKRVNLTLQDKMKFAAAWSNEKNKKKLS